MGDSIEEMDGDIIEMDDDKTDVTSQYKEKNWGKDENGQKVVDGYSFRGKQSFQKVVEGFKNIMKRGVENDFNGTKFKALDIRKQGNGLEIDIQITEKNDRGKAVMKLYGPSSKKKENVVMVTKYKESDSKYVLKLTENVVKPMMQKMLNQVETKISIKKSVSSKIKRQTLLKCPFCEVTSHSSPGLKGHITKKHQSVAQEEKEGSSDIIEGLLDEVIEIVDGKPEKLSLDENCDTIQGKYKKYKNKCEECNYCVESDKKYAVVQIMLKHKKDTCTKQSSAELKCDKCDFKANSRLSLKRHMRDIHDISTASTSPPPKRKRKTPAQAKIEAEEMEVETPNKELEEMEVDDLNKAEEKIINERSGINDKEIQQKDKIEGDKREPDTQNDLKKVIKENLKIKEEYLKCEKDLALKTEECEKLKIEIKDLQQLLQLKNQVQNLEVNTTKKITKHEVENLQNKNEKNNENNSPWQKVTYRTKKRQHSVVSKAPETSVEEEEHNCMECDFQATSKEHLEKHIKIKHRLTCRVCDEVFETKPNLMVHRKQKHANLVATCRNYKTEKCPFADSKCWWNHYVQKQSVAAEVKCFICDEKFENKTNMMIHRKKNHPELVRKCDQYEINNCRFKEESCWFKHEIKKEENERASSSKLVFQKVSGNLKPPITTPKNVQRTL